MPVTLSPLTLPTPGYLLPKIEAIIRRAGQAAMAVYDTDFKVMMKKDKSPVTQADTIVEGIIVTALNELTPNVPVVAEESVAAGHLPNVAESPFWLVDPIDGTREFMKRNGEFTLNIALIVEQRPVLGAVLAPAQEKLYMGASDMGATLSEGTASPRAITVRSTPDEGLSVVASRSHFDVEKFRDFLGDQPVHELINMGSSLKICILAEGKADLYPRLGRTMEWDTAAGHAVLCAAGGRLETLDGIELSYAKNPLFENSHFLAWGQKVTTL